MISRLVVFFTLATLGVGCLHRTPTTGNPRVSPADAEAYAQQFLYQGFDWCDAQVLGWSWGMAPEQAKAAGGQKLSAGVKAWDFDKLFLEPARTEAMKLGKVLCSYYESPYGYEDAEALAAYWGMSSVGEAKTAIAQKMTWGGTWSVQMALKAAWEQKYYPGDMDPDMDAANAFWDSELNYCDAELVAGFWGGDTWDAKVGLGYKVKMGMGRAEIEDNVLRAARQSAQGRGETTCNFWYTDLNIEQAEQLACLWGVELDEAKARVGTAAFEGRLSEVRTQLEQAGGSCQP